MDTRKLTLYACWLAQESVGLVLRWLNPLSVNSGTKLCTLRMPRVNWWIEWRGWIGKPSLHLVTTRVVPELLRVGSVPTQIKATPILMFVCASLMHRVRQVKCVA